MYPPRVRRGEAMKKPAVRSQSRLVSSVNTPTLHDDEDNHQLMLSKVKLIIWNFSINQSKCYPKIPLWKSVQTCNMIHHQTCRCFKIEHCPEIMIMKDFPIALKADFTFRAQSYLDGKQQITNASYQPVGSANTRKTFGAFGPESTPGCSPSGHPNKAGAWEPHPNAASLN